MHTPKEATIPAQIYLTRGQIAAMHELDHDVIVTEGPTGAEALDVWVLDPESLESDTHRSVVLDAEGNTLGDSRMSDSD